MKVKSIKPIKPVESRCISVNAPDKLFMLDNGLYTHNSVSQRNIIIGCLLRPEHWKLFGIDLKRVELNIYRKFGVTVATELEDAILMMRFFSAVMSKRFKMMEENGVNDYKDLPDPPEAIMLMIDEAGELLSTEGGDKSSEQGKQEVAWKGEAQGILGSLLRLGRAAGVHIVVCTQRPDAKLIPGESRDNCAGRLGCGTLQSSASTMVFQSGRGREIPGSPPGRIGLQYNQTWQGVGQGFFAKEDWLENYFIEHNIPYGEDLYENNTVMDAINENDVDVSIDDEGGKGLSDEEAKGFFDDFMAELTDEG